MMKKNVKTKRPLKQIRKEMATTYPVGIIAKFLLLTPRRIQMLVKDGVIPVPVKGQYDLVGSVQGYIRYLQKAREAHGGPSLEEERRLKIQIERKLKELEYLVEKKELIPRNEILGEFLFRTNMVKQGLWVLHRTLPQQLFGKDPREMAEIIKKATIQLYERFRRKSGVLKYGESGKIMAGRG